MAKTITVHINKGGQAKTTSAIFFATVLSKIGKTLLVDTDPQGTCTSLYSNHFEFAKDKTLTEVYADQIELSEAIVNIKNNFDFIPNNKGLVDIGEVLGVNQEYKLLSTLDQIQDAYEFIIMDTAPAVNLQTKQALVAADIIITPCTLEALSFSELIYIDSFIKNELLELKKSVDRPLEKHIILPTLYESNRTVQDMILNDMKERFKNVLSPIKRKTDVQQASYVGLGIAPIESTETYKRYKEELENILTLEAV